MKTFFHVDMDAFFVSVEELLETCDGFLLTGGRPNVHPSEYGEEETPAHGAFDRARDAITLPLIHRLPRYPAALWHRSRSANRSRSTLRQTSESIPVHPKPRFAP